MVAGATAGTRQKLSALTSSSSDMSSDNNAAAKVSEPFPSQNGKGPFKEAGVYFVLIIIMCSIIIIKVKPLYNGHLGDRRKSPLWRGSHYGEVGV